MFLARNITAKLAPNNVTGIGTGVNFVYRLIDVPRRMILALGNIVVNSTGSGPNSSPGNFGSGKVVQESAALAVSASKVLTLPDGYVAATTQANGGKNLRIIIVAKGILRVTIVSPDNTTSVFILKGTSGATLGNHDGTLTWTGTVTSVTVASPSTNSADTLFDYMLYEQPDLTLIESFRDQELAIGVNGP